MSWPINDGVKLGLGILGNLTALGLFLVPLATVATVVKLRSTEDYSVFPYVVTLVNCLQWTFYGLPIVGEGRTLVITINALGAFLEAIYVLIFFIYSAPKRRLQTCLYTGVGLLFFGVVAAVTVAAFHTTDSRSMFLGIVNDVVTVCMYAAPLEIMWLVVKTQSVKYMPFYLSLLSLTNGAAWTAYAVYVRDIYIGIPNAIGVLLGFGQLVLYALYHHIEVRTESRRHMMSKSASRDCLTEEGEGEREGASRGTAFLELNVGSQ